MEQLKKAQVPTNPRDAMVYVSGYISHFLPISYLDIDTYLANEEIYQTIRFNLKVLEVASDSADESNESSYYLKKCTSLEKKFDDDDYRLFRRELEVFRLDIEADEFSDHFNSSTPSDLSIEFKFESKSEKQNVLNLAAEMRELVLLSGDFEDDQKRRIIRRISAIEVEILKTKGMLRTVLDAVREIGKTAGEFGDDVKTLVDRAEQIGRIASDHSDRRSGLPEPEDTKQLPPPVRDVEESHED